MPSSHNGVTKKTAHKSVPGSYTRPHGRGNPCAVVVNTHGCTLPYLCHMRTTKIQGECTPWLHECTSLPEHISTHSPGIKKNVGVKGMKGKVAFSAIHRKYQTRSILYLVDRKLNISVRRTQHGNTPLLPPAKRLPVA